MPLFKCETCGCCENTATSRYWLEQMAAHEEKRKPVYRCSACDPEIGEWHGKFPQTPWTKEHAKNSGMPR